MNHIHVNGFITSKSMQIKRKSMFAFSGLSMNIEKNSLNEVIDLMKDNIGYCSLSTIDKTNKIISKNNNQSFPFLSFCGFSVTKTGIPYFCLSKISKHTQNINNNNHASIMINKFNFVESKPEQNFNTIASSKRVTFSGKINKLIPDNKKDDYISIADEYREEYLKKHPEAIWVDFPDFEFYRMDLIKDIYYIGGFKKATKISVKKYFQKFI